MEYMKGIDGLYIPEETAVTLGKFDGVHRGHQKLLSRILEKKNLKSVMFTINGRKSGFVLTDEEKRSMLEKNGTFLSDRLSVHSVSIRYGGRGFRERNPRKPAACKIDCCRKRFPFWI